MVLFHQVMKRKLVNSILLCASSLFCFFMIGRIIALFQDFFGESASQGAEIANWLRIIPAFAFVVGLVMTINHIRNYHRSFGD